MTEMLTALREHGLSDLEARPSPWKSRARTSVRRVDLMPTVERTVIPRLHAALQKDLRRPRHPLISAETTHREDVSDFAELLLGGVLERVCTRVDALRVAGWSLESIYLKLLAPTACHLRDLWSDDLCGFADVTFALCNLQSVLLRYAPDFYAEATNPDSGSRVLIVTPSANGTDLLTPMFGLMLMSQFFRREGWDASIERDLTCDGFRQTVGEWFDLVEVLAASDRQLDEIASGIRRIRRGSPNPAIGIVVCGQIFNDKPEYIRLVGADLVATDPLSSLSQAKSFVMTRQTKIRCLS